MVVTENQDWFPYWDEFEKRNVLLVNPSVLLRQCEIYVRGYLHVRADLWAKVTRALYYDLVDMGEERVVDGRAMFGVASAGEFFAMADAEQVREAR